MIIAALGAVAACVGFAVQRSRNLEASHSES